MIYPSFWKKKYLKNKEHYDLHKKVIQFQVGEKILVKTENKTSKFGYRYTGPFTIIRQILDVTYVVEIMKNRQLKNYYKHVNQLKKFKERINRDIK